MSFHIYDDYEPSDSFSKWDYLLQHTLILFTEPRILKKLADKQLEKVKFNIF